MLIETEDYNGAKELFDNQYAAQWVDIESVLTNMPLHL